MEIVKICSDEQLICAVKLAEEIWNQHFISILTKVQIDYMLGKYQSYAAMKAQIENEKYEYYLIKGDDGVFQGYFAAVPKEDMLFLSKLYIRQASRGKGYARKAVEFIKKYAQRLALSGIFLTVNRNNTNTVDIYKKMGFKIVSEADTDIGNGFFMNDYIMRTEI